MRRLVLVAGMVVLLGGCSSRSYLCNWCGIGPQEPSAVDPFFGRTRVPPPGTGQLGGQPTPDPYYPGAAPGQNPYAAPGSQPPAGTSPPGSGSSSTFSPNSSGVYGPGGSGSLNSGVAPSRGSAGAPQRSPSPQGYQPPGGAAGSYTPRDGQYQYQGTSTTNRLNQQAYANRNSPFRVEPPDLSRQSRAASAGSPTSTNTSRTPSQVRNSSRVASDRSVPAGSPATSSAVAGAGGPSDATPLEERERIVRTLQPRPSAHRAGNATPATGVRQTASYEDREARTGGSAVRPAAAPRRAGALIDIMDLPPAGSTTKAGGAVSRAVYAASRKNGSVIAADGRSKATGGRVVAAAASEPFEERGSPNYGFDTEYRWLRGKLEYSSIEQHWKLRYIPIDGETDDYGGSVVIDEADLPRGVERGDFIEVRGQIVSPTNDQPRFAPVYRVAEARQLGAR